MSDRDLEIVIRAKDEYSGAIEKAGGTIESAVTSAIKRFTELNGAQETAYSGLKKIEEGYRNLGSLAENNLAGESGGDTALTELRKREEEKYLIREKYQRKYIELLDVVYTEEERHVELLGQSKEALVAITTSSYQAMQTEMLRLVEAGRFSVKELGDVVLTQVKVELAGIAARAAVNAIFQTAVGFAHLAYGNKVSASLAFASAKTFGMVAGAALAATAGVHALVGGTASSSGTGSAKSSSTGKNMSDFPISSGALKEEAKPIQNVTVQIYNPLSTQNWSEIVENNIIPALNKAADRNISINVKSG